jgi:CheY-like chemotaxis protein/HPt (histidine-containing phosphotransfer) domain-containing protein
VSRVAPLQQALDDLSRDSGEEAGRSVEALGWHAHSLRGAAVTVSHDTIAALAQSTELAIRRWDPTDRATQEAVAAQASQLLQEVRGLPSSDLGAASADPVRMPRDREGPVVLHIEDNLSNLKLVERILDRRPQVRLAEARTGAAGLALAAELAPDLVLLDLRLPDISGEEVLRRLRGDQKTRAIPAVVISAEARPAESDRLLAAGADDFLVKPIDVSTFLGVVDTMLARVSR